MTIAVDEAGALRAPEVNAWVCVWPISMQAVQKIQDKVKKAIQTNMESIQTTDYIDGKQPSMLTSYGKYIRPII